MLQVADHTDYILLFFKDTRSSKFSPPNALILQLAEIPVILNKKYVEGYRAVGTLHDSSLSSDFLLLLLFFIDSVDGKSTIKRPIKIQTHFVVRKHAHTGSKTDVKLYGRTDSWTNVQIDRQADICKSDTHEFNF